MHILLTRQLQDSKDLIQNFKSNGFKVSNLPLLEINKLAYKEIKIYNYNAIIFTSSNAIRFLDLKGTFDTNNLTIEPGSEKIMAQTAGDEMVVDTNNAGFALVYQDSTFGWRLKYH